MAGALELSGAKQQKETRYSPIATNRFFDGIYTQRNPLRDAGSTRYEERYLGGRNDGLIDGSNTEISNRLTLIRRPGLSVYNSQIFSATDFFYSFRLEDGSIKVFADTLDGVYDITGPNNKILIFPKVPGDGQTFFQSVLDILYLSDKTTNQFKLVESPKVWTCNTQYFPGDFIVDPNGNLERVARAIDLPPGSGESPTNGPNTAQTGANSGSGVAWSNPGNVSSNSAQATVVTTSGVQASATMKNCSAVTVGNNSYPNNNTISPILGGEWECRGHFGTGEFADYTWRTRTDQTPSFNKYIIFSGISGLSVPAGATILGISTSFDMMAQSDNPGASLVQNVALFNAGNIIGTPKSSSQQITATTQSFPFGGKNDKWGAPLTDTIINSGTFGVGILISTPSDGRQFLNAGDNFGITVYYTVSSTNGSQFLQATNFGFALTHAPLGIQVKFNGELTGSISNAAMTAQLILGGNPVGSAKSLLPGGSLSSITLGDTNDLWGAILTTVDENSTTFGVEFQVSGGGTWSVGDVQMIITTGVDNLISGPCGFGQPNWPTTWGARITDGNITWINNGPQLQKFAITPPTDAPSVTNVGLPSSSVNNLTPWGASTWYLSGLRIVDSNGFIQKITTAGTTGTVQPTWDDTYGADNPDGTAHWTTGTNATWAANFAYVVGDAVSVTYNAVTPIGVSTASSSSYNWPGHTNQFGSNLWTNSVAVRTDFFVVSQAGTSASTQPINPSSSVNTAPNPYPPSSNTWQNGIGTQITDGGVIWQNAGPSATWNTIGASQNIAAVNTIIDVNGNQQQATLVGETNVVHPAWSTNINQTTIDSGQTWVNIGPVTSGVAVSPGTGTGATSLVWRYTYTWRNSLTGDESSASPLSAAILLAPNSAILVQGANSPDPQVDTIRIYRTTAGGGIPFLLVEIPNVALTGTWTYIDTTPDSGLNNLIQAPVNLVNNPPPVGLINLVFHLERIFGSIGNTVYYSSGPDTNPGNGATAFDPLNFFIFPSRVVRMVATSFGLLVFTIDDIYLIAGQGTASSPLFAQPYAQGIGLLSYNELDVNAGIIYMKTTDGRVIELQVGTGISEIGFAIGDQFYQLTTGTGNGFINGAGYLTWHAGSSKDTAIYVANGTDGWFRCSPTSAPETGLTWSPKATVANSGGAMAVQSIEVLPGVKKLLVGPATSGPILMRDLSINSDNGTSYPCFATIGGLTLAQPGQTAPVVFITTDCLAIGSQIIPSTLFDELPSAGTFNSLAVGSNPVNDPPQLVPSTTIFNKRWYCHETQEPMLCRWAFLKVAWIAENAANELLEFSIWGSILKE